MKMKNVMIAVMVELLILVTAGTVAAQAAGRLKLTKDQVQNLWGNYLVRCGDRVFVAENYGLYVRITEFRGNLSCAGEEFILDKAWLAANRIESKGTLFIHYTESRSCQYSKDNPKGNSPWSEWTKPMLGAPGAAFPYVKANGKLVVEAGVVVRVGCDAIAAIDTLQRK